MIDSHCHLAGAEFVADLAAVVSRAQAAGIVRCLVVIDADDDQEIARAATVREAWPDTQFAVGVHPHQAHRFATDPAAAARLTEQRMSSLPAVCALGEIGLDYHYDFSPRDVQLAVFRAQLALARARRLPVVIHTREAESDTLRVIEEVGAGTLRGVFHCFSGDTAAAARALATGFHVSVPGIVTFSKSADLRDATRTLPHDRLLIETDSPYLAPVPYRGRRNEPAYVLRVLETVADVRGTSQERLAAQLVANFDTLFGARGRDRELRIPSAAAR